MGGGNGAGTRGPSEAFATVDLCVPCYTVPGSILRSKRPKVGQVMLLSVMPSPGLVGYTSCVWGPKGVGYRGGLGEDCLLGRYVVLGPGG